MRLSTFLIADHAEAVNGKLYVTGGCWNRLGVAGLPATQPHFTVAATLHVPWDAANERHVLALDLIDADGHSLLQEPVANAFESGRPAGTRPGDESLVVLAFHFNGLTFAEVGTKEFVLGVDGEEVGRIAFKVELMPAGAGG
jgi:hypothetical protein